MRLVPRHDADQGICTLQELREKIAPDGVDVDVRLIHSGDPCLIPVNNRYIQAATRAFCMKFGAKTQYSSALAAPSRSWAISTGTSGLPSVMMGFGLPDDNLHRTAFQREVQPQEFRTGNRVADPFYAGGGKLSGRQGERSPQSNAAGFVLAGGQSSRMGMDKALVEFRGLPLVVHALNILRAAGLSASIAGARSDLKKYASVISDFDTPEGPLGGICAAMVVTLR